MHENYRADCFANKGSRCSALIKKECYKCPFYKSAKQREWEISQYRFLQKNYTYGVSDAELR